MAVSRATITYADGSTESAAITPWVLMAQERQYGADAQAEHPMEANLWGFYIALQQQGLHAHVQFDDWAKTVEDIDLPEDEPADPTPPAPSPEASSPSL